jgi:hypothetical protein
VFVGAGVLVGVGVLVGGVFSSGTGVVQPVWAGLVRPIPLFPSHS